MAMGDWSPPQPAHWEVAPPPDNPPAMCPGSRRQSFDQQLMEAGFSPLTEASKVKDLPQMLQYTLAREMQELGERLRRETREDLGRFVEEHAARLQEMLEKYAGPAVRRADKKCLTLPSSAFEGAMSKSSSNSSNPMGREHSVPAVAVTGPSGLNPHSAAARDRVFQWASRSGQEPVEDLKVSAEDSMKSKPSLLPGFIVDEEETQARAASQKRRWSSCSDPTSLGPPDPHLSPRTSGNSSRQRMSNTIAVGNQLSLKPPRSRMMLRESAKVAQAKRQASPSTPTSPNGWRPTERALARLHKAQLKGRLSLSSPKAVQLQEAVRRQTTETWHRVSDMQSEHSWRNSMTNLVKSDWFDYLISAVLVLNAVCIGVQADVTISLVKNDETDVPPAFVAMDLFFCFTFAAELACRVMVEHFYFWSWHNETWKWNWFDTINVTLSLCEEIVVPRLSNTKMMSLSSGAVVVRTLRMWRVARLVRMVRLIPELKSMVYLIMASTSSFVWTCLLMMIFMYCFAVYFTELATEIYLAAPDEDVGNVMRYWGSIERSILTLFQAMSGGVSWHVVVDVFSTQSGPAFWFNSLVFSMYIAFMTLVVLNLVTGVFVDGAQRIMSEERDEALINMASRLFAHADVDCSKGLEKEEFVQILTSNVMDDFLQQIGLNKSDAGRLFHVFDADNSGDVSLMEFVSGCLKMNAAAKATDFAQMRYDLNLMSEQLFRCFGAVEDAVLNLRGAAPSEAGCVEFLRSSSRDPWSSEAVE